MLELAEPKRDLSRLLRCAVAGVEPDVPPRDWAKVLELANLRQVDHFLFLAVVEWPADPRPDAALMARWRSDFFGAVAKYAAASAQAAELLRALTDAGIRVLPLKGIWLAEKIYPDGAGRPMCDFDLLVPSEKLEEARRVFERVGYAESTQAIRFEDMEHGKEIHYRHPDHPMMVELHWRLWNERLVNIFDAENTNWVWDGLDDDELHGAPVSVFSPNRMLIYLAQHIQNHALTMPLRAYLDLVLLAQSAGDRFDLAELEREAKLWRTPFAARFILAVAFDLFDFPPPAALREFVAPANERRDQIDLAKDAVLGLTAENSAMLPLIEDYRKASLFRYARVGLGKLFQSPDTLRAVYPAAVKKFGLLGGYCARWNFLFGRWVRLWKSKGDSDPKARSDVENYQARRDLSAWLHERDMSEWKA